MSALLQSVASNLQNTPPEIATLVLAMIPVGELRGALPIALTIYKLPVLQAAFWAVLGNMIPVWFLLIFFEKVSKWLMERSDFWNRFFEKLFERTQHKLEDKVEKYGVWALTLFVAIPLPVTGAWTGSLAAFVFGLPRKQAFFAILAGVIIASVIVTLITLGATATVNAFN